MKLSETIQKLQKILDENGDIPTIIEYRQMGTIEYLIKDISFESVYRNTKEMESDGFSDEIIKEFFPNWDGKNHEYGDVNSLIIKTGKILSNN